jgi:hypothetical protein
MKASVCSVHCLVTRRATVHSLYQAVYNSVFSVGSVIDGDVLAVTQQSTYT